MRIVVWYKSLNRIIRLKKMRTTKITKIEAFNSRAHKIEERVQQIGEGGNPIAVQYHFIERQLPEIHQRFQRGKSAYNKVEDNIGLDNGFKINSPTCN